MDLQQKSQKPKSIMDEADEALRGLAPEAASITGANIAAATRVVPATVHPVVEEQSAVNMLCTLLLKKEEREARAEQAIIDRNTARQVQRDKNTREIDAKFLLKQAKCRHLKGGKSRGKTQKIDYAVYQFTFSDADMYVRCQVCGMKWRKNDTVQYLSRVDKKGKEHKVANHTKIGWIEALQMADQSSNTASTSEIPQQAFSSLAHGGAIDSVGTRMGTDGVPFTPRIVDSEGQAVSDYEV